MAENHDSSKDGVGENALNTVGQVVEGRRKTKKKWPLSLERAHMLIEIVLDVEGGGIPLVRVLIDDAHLGYINSEEVTHTATENNAREDTENDSGNDGNADLTKNKNRGIFEIECSRRGNRQWNEHSIYVIPINDDHKYASSLHQHRFNPPNIKHGNQPLEVRVPIKLDPIKLKKDRRHLLLKKLRHLFLEKLHRPQRD